MRQDMMFGWVISEAQGTQKIIKLMKHLNINFGILGNLNFTNFTKKLAYIKVIRM